MTQGGPRMYEQVVRSARASEAEMLAEIIAGALYEDPPNVWAFPNAVRRQEIPGLHGRRGRLPSLVGRTFGATSSDPGRGGERRRMGFELDSAHPLPRGVRLRRRRLPGAHRRLPAALGPIECSREATHEASVRLRKLVLVPYPEGFTDEEWVTLRDKASEVAG